MLRTEQSLPTALVSCSLALATVSESQTLGGGRGLLVGVGARPTQGKQAKPLSPLEFGVGIA